MNEISVTSLQTLCKFQHRLTTLLKISCQQRLLGLVERDSIVNGTFGYDPIATDV